MRGWECAWLGVTGVCGCEGRERGLGVFCVTRTFMFVSLLVVRDGVSDAFVLRHEDQSLLRALDFQEKRTRDQ